MSTEANFWEARKLQQQQEQQAEQERKAAERKEKKKQQAEQAASTPASTSVSTSAPKEEKPKKKKPQNKENQQPQQQNGSSQKEATPIKKKQFKKKQQTESNEASPAANNNGEEDFQTVERKNGGRRQFSRSNKRTKKEKSENSEKKEKKQREPKEPKEPKEAAKKDEKTSEPIIQPAQVKVFSAAEASVPQGGDSWVNLLRGKDSVTTEQPGESANTSTKKKPSSSQQKKTVIVNTAKKPSAPQNGTEKKKNEHNFESGKNILRSTEIDIDESLLDEVGNFIQPRGMINSNNSCYMNAVLQSLVSLPQFYQTFKRIGKLALDNEEYPLSNKFARLVSEFQPMKHRNNGDDKNKKYYINDSYDKLNPSYIVDYIQQSATNLEDAFLLGTQHDAHEFYTYIMSRLHDELKKTESSLGRKSPQTNKKKKNHQEVEQQAVEETTTTSNEEWKEVGKKNKSNAIREHENGESSAIARLFGGKMRSFVQKQGESKGSAVVEPFYSLHLPIKDDNIKGVKFALREMVKEEQVAEKQAKSSIYQLPKILVLHLRRFDYSPSEGVQKITKRIRFDYELSLDDKVVPNLKTIAGKSSLKYRLASIICHHGKDATGGHYSTYIQHGCGKWVHIDDTKVTVVSLQHVLDQQAYILTYVQDENAEHYKVYGEGSTSSPLFNENGESSNSGEKKEHKKKDHKKKEGKPKKPQPTSPIIQTSETTTPAKTDL